jgi:hypothetical protein
MRTFMNMHVLLWLALGLGAATAEDQELVPILGRPLVTNSLAQSGDLRQMLSGRQPALCVEANRLPLKPWDPEKESLPIDLRAEAPRAWSMVATQMLAEGNPDLVIIDLRRFGIPERIIERSGRSRTDFTNQWVALLTFATSPPRFSCKTMAVFLDGTYAIEREADPGDVGHGVQVPPLVKTGGRDRSRAETRDEGEPNAAPVAVVDPQRKLQESDFTIPRVQWNPQTEPFPLDLRTESVRARALLAEASPEGGASFFLWEILMTKFAPAGAIDAQKLSPLDHRFHWLVVFRFHGSASLTIRPWEVYMLLDGTVMAVIPARFF